jgi:hypothetical protein
VIGITSRPTFDPAPVGHAGAGARYAARECVIGAGQQRINDRRGRRDAAAAPGIIEGRRNKRLREDLGIAGRRQFEIPGFEIVGPGVSVRKSAGEEICVTAGRRVDTSAPAEAN